MIHTQEISSIDEAKSYIGNLIKHDLLFHFDDDVSELEPQCFTEEEVPQVGARMDEIYSDEFDWGDDVCPIGYAIRIGDLEISTTFSFLSEEPDNDL